MILIIFKTLIIKNFMSIGEISQSINFNNEGMSLILGENLDMISDSQNLARNGAGKSAIINALSYVLYGQALSNIRKEYLVNNINEKGMYVGFEFEKDGHNYKIERGRRPNFFRFFVDDKQSVSQNTDEAQGESKNTQDELEKVLGMSHNLFKHIVALNTNTEPFLKLSSKQQREFIEELLGMKILSEKAESLKELLRLTKDDIKSEELIIETMQAGNKKIEKNIEDMSRRSDVWESDKQKKIKDLEDALIELQQVDIDQELKDHQTVTEYLELNKQFQQLNKDKSNLEREQRSLNTTIEKNSSSLESAMKKSCPTCSQDLKDNKHEEIVNDLAVSLEKDSERLTIVDTRITQLNIEVDRVNSNLNLLGDKPKTYYKDINHAYNHRTDIELCMNGVASVQGQENPYVEQIESLKQTALQDPDFDSLNELVRMKDHQEFLMKLLTSNESFIRKKIVDQNIAFLNDRLAKYLEKLGLPHNVMFQNDLTVQITNFGKELDFDNLSRGENTRLVLALSWSFRDIFEVLNTPINVILIDELLDLGSDSQLTESAVGIIRRMNQERNKSVFLISHHETLISKIPTILRIVKENGFSSFHMENDFS